MSRQKKHEEWMERHYKSSIYYNHGDIRSALGDAAGLCDAIAADIMDSVKPRTKLKLQRAEEISRALILAGNAIWQMRDRIKPTSESNDEATHE